MHVPALVSCELTEYRLIKGNKAGQEACWPSAEKAQTEHNDRGEPGNGNTYTRAFPPPQDTLQFSL